MKILVTGCAGFIGFHVSKKLLERGDSVVGVDNLNDYYDVSLKEARLKILKEFPDFKFHKIDISEGLEELKDQNFEAICHLAAQAGVRYSLENPLAYEKSNSLGTLQILEFARHNEIPKVVYASSSSVYGNSSTGEKSFKETQKLDEPISLYAATKKANELYAHVYNHLFGIKTIGLRFFTVYGPWGRPDMALFKFTKNILSDSPMDVYNRGLLQRDFTYIDDIVSGVISAIDSNHECEIFNLARGESVELIDFIKAIEKATGKKAILNMMPMQPGDVLKTSGDITKAKTQLSYNPKTSIEEGVKSFVEWYKGYYER
ncbi:MAG: GDP-mannose 4,6-dehydratase [Nanoarchaeota archaeon]|nr:GDP-mannose 4,6-dehydratase [Nanoarchaeota archaeon]